MVGWRIDNAMRIQEKQTSKQSERPSRLKINNWKRYEGEREEEKKKETKTTIRRDCR
jgi:hypothetical protein